MKKGISAVIAVVLILMITVALSAAAYVWFSGIFDTITDEAENAAGDTADAISTSFSIDSARHVIGEENTTIYFTNTGSSDIDLTKVNIFVDSLLTGKTDGFTGILSPGNLQSLEIANKTQDPNADYNDEWCGDVVLIKYKSMEQVTTIQC